LHEKVRKTLVLRIMVNPRICPVYQWTPGHFCKKEREYEVNLTGYPVVESGPNKKRYLTGNPYANV
jgi:hypothetical protein